MARIENTSVGDSIQTHSIEGMPKMKLQLPDPRYGNTVLDSCALGNLGVEYEAATKILELANEEQVSVITTYGVIDEISHPSTPQHVKNIAARMIFTISTRRTPEEELRLQSIHAEMTGNGKPDKYAADADHIFEAGKYGSFFITNDERILKKREQLGQLSGVYILRPSEWLIAYQGSSE